MNNNVMFSSGKDNWETPQDLFKSLNDEFHFTLDPCCTKETAKCRKFYTQEEDGLKQNWGGEIVFVNPPYSAKDQDKWVAKCYKEAQKPNTKVVALLPARTDTKRFHDYIWNHANIRFIKGRLKFGNSKNSAPFPSMIVIFKNQVKHGN